MGHWLSSQASPAERHNLLELCSMLESFAKQHGLQPVVGRSQSAAPSDEFEGVLEPGWRNIGYGVPGDAVVLNLGPRLRASVRFHVE